MIISIMILSCLGFFVSLYTFIIEEKIKRDRSYKPVCDISDAISCSKPIMIQYGNLIGFSNTIARPEAVISRYPLVQPEIPTIRHSARIPTDFGNAFRW